MNEIPIYTILLGMGTLILMAIALISFIVYYQRKQFNLQLKQQTEIQNIESENQKKLLKNSLEVQEAERRHISKDLHDEIGGLLSATKLSIKTFSRELKDNEELYKKVQNTTSLVTEALAQVRSLSKDLTPRTLENFGLVDSLFEFADKMEPTSKTHFEVSINGLESKERINKDLELAVYRIVQELTNNSLKHANADNIEIKLNKGTEFLYLSYSDNGVGFEYEKTKNDIKSGLGLDNIISRVNVMNGVCNFTSAPNKGTQVEIRIPV